MQLDQVFDDRQAQAETARCVSLCGVVLAKAIEDMRQELRTNPRARVLDTDTRLARVRLD
jgi:hypothetical protein